MGRSKIVGALPRMPLQVLQYAIQIAERGSTLAAAHDVNLTSSALSRQISQLEHELGITLFERHSRGMRPTSAGEVFLDAARQMIRRMERLAADLDDVHSLRRGHVTVYASEALVQDFLLPLVTDMAVSYPNIKVEIVVAAGRQAEMALLEERAELAVVFNARTHAELEIVAENKNSLVAIAKRGGVLSDQKAIAAEDLIEGHSLALPPRSYATRVAFDTLLPPEKTSFVPHLTINSIAALKHYAASGAGVAVVPELSVWQGSSDRDRFDILQIVGAGEIGTRVCLCRHGSRPLSAAASHMLGQLMAAFPSYTEGF
ncbi:LysR family transcriptional regulator [Rhizobium mesosinicum]|uniref:LysR family transcriptional regulator n=1 Tax=Rhizobium mesosinicum TaxID=335017 RepID=A0ABS7GP91_9HYPH|nr:LysR family transcriptional regulator [Rhizobium mesosinicum]MBW9051148.1 LysR family transcriptional regulator [Rhizobium mesosinicum]